MTGRHRPPPPPLLTRPRVAIADGALLTAALAAAAITVAPHTPQPNPAALPTAVELREPSGHGGPIGPLATPSIGADGAWQPEDGPVVVNGQALPRPTVVAPVPAAKAAPSSTTTPLSSTVTAATTPTAEPTPTEEPVATPEVTPTEPVETTEPAVPPAEPTVPVVVEVTP